MRTLKQEGIPFRIEGDYFLTGRQSLSHRFSEWVKLFLFNSLSLSPTASPQHNTRVSRDNRSKRDYKRCQFCLRIDSQLKNFSPSHVLSREYFRAGNPSQGTLFSFRSFLHRRKPSLFQPPPSFPRTTASKRNFLVVDRGRKVFSRDRLESVSSPSFLPPRLTLTPMEITPSTLFFTRIPSRYSYSVAEFPDESNNNLGTTLRPTEKELNSQNQSLLN